MTPAVARSAGRDMGGSWSVGKVCRHARAVGCRSLVARASPLVTRRKNPSPSFTRRNTVGPPQRRTARPLERTGRSRARSSAGERPARSWTSRGSPTPRRSRSVPPCRPRRPRRRSSGAARLVKASNWAGWNAESTLKPSAAPSSRHCSKWSAMPVRVADHEGGRHRMRSDEMAPGDRTVAGEPSPGPLRRRGRACAPRARRTARRSRDRRDRRSPDRWAESSADEPRDLEEGGERPRRRDPAGPGRRLRAGTSSSSRSTMARAAASVSATTGSTGTMTFRSPGSRPAAAAAARSSRRAARAPLDVGRRDQCEVRFRGGEPARTRRGAGVHDRRVHLRRARDVERALDAQLRTGERRGAEPRGSMSVPGDRVRDPRVVVPRLPQTPQHLDELLGAVVARLVVGVRVAAVIAAARGSAPVTRFTPARPPVRRSRDAVARAVA